MAVNRKPDDPSEADKSADPVGAEIAALRADLAELGSVVARIGRSRAAGLKSAAGAAAHDGYAKGEAVLDDMLGELKSLEGELADATRRRPFAALGLAALFGFLFGVFFPALIVARLLASLTRIARARLHDAGRRARLRGGLIAGCVAAGLAAGGFLVGAATVALAERIGTLGALLVMAAVALAVLLALLVGLAVEARRHRERAARRERLDRQLYRAAALALVPRRAPSRPVVGLALVALGALMVLARRGDDDRPKGDG